MAHRPKRAPFREAPTGEAYAFDRWRFGAMVGGRPGDVQIVRPGAYGLVFDVPEPMTFEPEQVQDGLAVLCIEGPLEHHSSWCWANYEDIATHTRAAAECDATQIVCLKVDSPGGVAVGMGGLHREILRIRRDTGKPIVAYVNGMACSAAYNVVAACSEIWLGREDSVGAIGVILCTIDESAALNAAGIKVRYVVTGDRKADLHPGTAITDDVLKVAQGKVDKLGGHMFRAVARARGTSPEAVEGLQAAVFEGKDAVRVGLADGVADWPEFLGTLRATLGATVP